MEETHSIQQHQKNKENDVEKQNINEGKKHSPSPSSSPSHEFSFTISLHSSSTTTTTKSPPPSLALDLSPADDIFFHGHLLPLQLLSHFPSSPRFSTNSSIDSFSVPLRDSLQDENNTSTREHNTNNLRTTTTKEEEEEIKSISKPSSFSLFGSTKGRKDKDEKQNKRKLGYDHVIHAMKKYLRMMLFRGRREKEVGLFHGQAYSRSGNIMRKSKPEMRGRNSAPASMRTSPTNSGLLFATNAATSNDSTMEELQAAVQAAIAHCKNSIAKEDKLITSS